MKLSIVTKWVLKMIKMASYAFKYKDLISKVTIMSFYEDFLFGRLVWFLWIIKKVAEATFLQFYVIIKLNGDHLDAQAR